MMAYFCDRLKEVSVVSAVARLEFSRLEPVGANGEFRTEQGLILALPVGGLVDAIRMLMSVKDGLSSRGLLPPETPAAAPPQPTQSPNFARGAMGQPSDS